jgi:enamine deaminase RidA (YjgF/YER057c/UK114 family)
MGSKIETRLNELGITLPKPAAPAANYVPYVVSGNLIFVAGQIPVLNGEIKFKGRLGKDMSIEDGYQAARLCGLNIIAQAGAAAGDLDRIKRIVKLGGFVGCTADFTDHPKVVNGASDLMVEIFGEPAGQHARFAVGAPSLPLGVAVEVDAVIEIA